MNKKIFFILLLAFFVRLISLNQSLWLDEATTAKVVQTFSYADIVTKFSPFDFHPPLYYFVMKFWTSIFGLSEISLRFPSVLFSLLAGIMLYRIAGTWAAAFFLFNPLIVYYSQEARMYMLVTFLLTCAVYFFIKKKLLFFNLFCILSFYTFYGSVFLITGFLMYSLYKKQYGFLLTSLTLNLASFIIISPLLYQQWLHARESMQIVLNWKQALGTVSIKNLLLIPLKFSVGRISFEPKWLYYLVSGGWTIFIIAKLRHFNFFLFLFVFPIVLGLLFSFLSPLLQYFRFLYLIPLMSILLAIIVKRGLYDRAMHVIVIAGFLVFAFIYLLFPQFHREDWKQLALSLKNTRTVYMISSSSDPLTYYLPTISVKDIRSLKGIELEKSATVIPYTADIYGFDYKSELRKKGFTYKETKSFRGVWYEIWVRNKDYAGSFLYSFITEAI